MALGGTTNLLVVEGVISTADPRLQKRKHLGADRQLTVVVEHFIMTTDTKQYKFVRNRICVSRTLPYPITAIPLEVR